MDRRAGVAIPARPGRRPHVAWAALLLALVSLFAPLPVPGQEPAAPALDRLDRARADSLLTLVDLARVLPGQATAFANQLRRTAPGLPGETWSRLGPALEEELAPDRIREDVVAFLVREAPDGSLAAALAALRGGAAPAADSVADATAPDETLEEWVARLGVAPPPPERLEVVAELAEARAAPDFWVVISEAVRRAAHGVAAELDSMPPYRRMDETGYRVLREEARENVVISSLYRYREAPDDLLRRAAEAWSREPAAWFLETYTLAVAEALVDAGARLQARLDEPPPPGGG